MNDSDLCQLIREALAVPSRAEALAHAIDHLLQVKQYLGPGWLPYYDEALPRTMRDVEKNINLFPKMYSLNMPTVNCQNSDSDEAKNVRICFVKWVVMILKRDCHDVKRGRVRQPKFVRMSDRIGEDDGLTIEDTIADDLTRTGIQRILEKELKFLGLRIREYIKLDPDMRLRNCHPRNRLNVHCQILSQKLLLEEPPLNPRQVAKELNVPEQTVYDRWRNYCLPLLREIALKLENERG